MGGTVCNLCVYIIINTIKDDDENNVFFPLLNPFRVFITFLLFFLIPLPFVVFLNPSLSIFPYPMNSGLGFLQRVFWQFPSLPVISIENPSIVLLVYIYIIIALERYFEIEIALNSYVMNWKFYSFLMMMCPIKQRLFTVRDTDIFFYCIQICKRTIFESQVQYILHSMRVMLYVWIIISCTIQMESYIVRQSKLVVGCSGWCLNSRCASSLIVNDCQLISNWNTCLMSNLCLCMLWLPISEIAGRSDLSHGTYQNNSKWGLRMCFSCSLMIRNNNNSGH